VNFLLRLMKKDLEYATGEAQAHGIGFNMGTAAANILDQASGKVGRKDFSAVVEALR